MKTLIENLYNNNVVFSYYGFIDESVLAQIAQVTKSKLATNGESASTIARVTAAVDECSENIIKHNFYPEESKVKYKSLLVVSKKDDFYFIDTINIVNAEQKHIIEEQIDLLKAKSPEQIQEMKSKGHQNNSNTLTVSTGLMELVLKADNWNCTFKELNGDFLFNVNYGISCLN